MREGRQGKVCLLNAFYQVPKASSEKTSLVYTHWVEETSFEC